MEKSQILSIIEDWKHKNKIRLYTPYKYFKGYTSKRIILKRLREMKLNKEKTRGGNFETDKNMKTKKSKYHTIFEKRFKISSSSSLEEKAKVTGVPLSILKQVYKKGIAAYYSGHRPGATPTQWANSRVDSFLTLGCTVFSADANLFSKIKPNENNKKRVFFLKQTPTCPKTKREKFKKKKTNSI